jgi:hypothetical protein
VFAAATGQFEKFTQDARNKIAIASMGAINDAADFIKTQGRANIANAGFSKRWQNAFRVNVYPDKGKRVSIHPALIAWHKIPYAGIFEEGGTITGSPFLWLPLPNVPKTINGKHMSPKNYQRFVGKLFRFKAGTSRVPLLGGYMAAGARGGGHTKITVSALKRGNSGKAGKGVRLVPVPLFFGLSSVNMRKRFDLKTVFDRANAQLPQYYLNHFRR